MKKLYFLTIFLTCLSVFFIATLFPVKAISETIGNLYLEHDVPIFSASEIWYPGKSLTKSIVIGNLDTVNSHTAGLIANVTTDSSLTDVLQIVVRYGAATLWGPGTLRNFISAGEVPLTTISPKVSGDVPSVTYDLTISMDNSLGNPYQGQKTIFDFVFGFIGEPTPTPTSAPGAAGATSDGGGTGGAPSCGATAPQAPQSLTATAGGIGEVNLSWLPATGAITHYLIAYGTVSGNYIYGNPNVGNVTSYTVTGLSSGVRYYFVVKAVNDCAPGPYSNEAVTRSGGATGVLVATGPAAGFNVLGEKEEGQIAGAGATESGGVAGVETEKGRKICFWWLVFSFLALLLNSFYFYWYRKELKREKYRRLLPFMVSLLAFLGDKFMHYWWIPSKYCYYMWAFSLIALLVPLAFWWFVWRKDN